MSYMDEDFVLRFMPLSEEAQTPRQADRGSAGYDLFSVEDVSLAPGEIHTVGLGFAAKMPYSHYCMICPRSGLAAKHGITVLNSPGIVDASYRGEWKVCLINLGSKTYQVKKGHRIAQAVFRRKQVPKISTVKYLDDTQRGSGGFGSSGT